MLPDEKRLAAAMASLSSLQQHLPPPPCTDPSKDKGGDKFALTSCDDTKCQLSMFLFSGLGQRGRTMALLLH